MKKRCIGLLLGVLLAFTTVGCETVTVNREKDMAQVVATVGDLKITKGQIYDQVSSLLLMYYGIDIYDDSLSQEYRDYIYEILVDALNAEVDYQVMSIICEQVAPLTEEEIAASNEEAEEYFDQLRTILGYDAENPDEYEGDIEADLDEYLEQVGTTREQYKEDLLVNARYDKMKEMIYGEIEATEAQIQDQWLEDYGNQQEAAEKNDEFASYKQLVNPSGKSVGEYVLYKAEGFIMAKQILVHFTEEDDKIIEDLEEKISDAEDDLADLDEEYDLIQESRDEAEKAEDTEEVTRLNERLSEKQAEITAKKKEIEDLENDVEEALKTAQANVQDTIDEIYEKLENGESFDDVLQEYNEDPGMTVEPNSLYGYLIAPDTDSYSAYDTWAKQFVDAARSLEEAGDVSEPAASTFGVHIVSLVYGTDAAEVDYEYNRGVTKTVTESNLGAEAWQEELTKRREEMGVKLYETRLKYEK